MTQMLTREIRILVPLVLAVVGVSAAVYLADVVGPRDQSSETPAAGRVSDPAEPLAQAERATLPWRITGRYRAENQGVGLTVLSFRATPERTTILYALDADAEASKVEAVSMALSDDMGNDYPINDRGFIGASNGVSSAILTTGSIESKGSKSLALVVDKITVSDASGSAKSLSGNWSVEFLEAASPPGEGGYDLGGRVAPEVVELGTLRIALASGPGSAFIRLLIQRGDAHTALYGYAPDGVGSAISEMEWHELFRAEHGYDDPGLPYGWDGAVAR